MTKLTLDTDRLELTEYFWEKLGVKLSKSGLPMTDKTKKELLNNLDRLVLRKKHNSKTNTKLMFSSMLVSQMDEIKYMFAAMLMVNNFGSAQSENEIVILKHDWESELYTILLIAMAMTDKDRKFDSLHIKNLGGQNAKNTILACHKPSDRKKLIAALREIVSLAVITSQLSKKYPKEKLSPIVITYNIGNSDKIRKIPYSREIVKDFNDSFTVIE